MNEHSTENDETEKTGEQELLALMKRMQQQLSFLEKKIDTLLSQAQPSERPFRDRNFSKGHRPFRPSHRHERGPREERSGERPYSEERHYDRPRRSGEGRPFHRGSSEGGRDFPRKKRHFRRD